MKFTDLTWEDLQDWAGARVVAKHYVFTEEELDFIINYDIQYRMGLNGDINDGEV